MEGGGWDEIGLVGGGSGWLRGRRDGKEVRGHRATGKEVLIARLRDFCCHSRVAEGQGQVPGIVCCSLRYMVKYRRGEVQEGCQRVDARLWFMEIFGMDLLRSACWVLEKHGTQQKQSAHGGVCEMAVC